MSHDDEHIASDQNYDAASNIGQAGYYHGTDYSIPYMSAWSRIHDHPTTKNVLRHMGCTYMGTEGIPPTLLALKQHAQSLAVLIAHLDPSVNSGRVDAREFDFDPATVMVDENGHRHYEYIDNPERRMELGDAFDWLSDLSVPYVNDDPNHHKPLNALVNEVKDRHDVLGTSYHCPLAEVQPRQRGDKAQNGYFKQVSSRPYASHHNLVMHANECLERLDHEFSATGGIMSLIPEEGRGANTQELADAQNSLLGQMLTWMQSLVLRDQELEMNLAACTDALAGEAVVPLQHLSMKGPDGRSGREIAYPQDRWVLVNAGDDVWNYLHDTLDRQEALIEAKQEEWSRGGLVTERAWMQERGGYQYARGLVLADVNTRFYRLQGQGRSTIFVLPAWEHHPAAAWTKAIQQEGKPKVVSVVTPKYPERATELERRWADRYKASEKKATDYAELDQKRRQLELAVHDLTREKDKNAEIARKLTTVLSSSVREDQIRELREIIEENRNLRARVDDITNEKNSKNILFESTSRALELAEKQRDELRKRVVAMQNRLADLTG